MEEKKISELNEEALEAITGGAYYELNESTHDYDIFTKDGQKVTSVPMKLMAADIAQRLTNNGD